MKLEQGKFCPLIGKDCIQLQCAWFTQVRGMNPNTGEEVDDWSCAVTWLPTLMIENSQQQRHTSSAIESFRNETVKSTMKAQEIYQRELELKAQERLMQSRQIKNVTDIEQ
tara:strand:+ start:385 stop:717 length:333 start_codon:yes stop_codon:yes gene_type:complete